MDRKEAMQRFQSTGIYGITAERLSAGRSNPEAAEQMLQGGIGADRLEQAEAVEVGHVPVREHQVGAQGLDLGQALGAIFALGDFGVVVPGLTQGTDDDHAHGAAVVGDYDLHD